MKSKIALEWDKFWENIVIALLSSILFVAFTQVIFRYVLNSPLTWSLAICRYMYVWMVFVGSAVVMMTEGHLKLSFFVDKCSDKNKRRLEIAERLVVLFILLVIFVKEGVYLTEVTSRQISAEVGIKLSWVYVAVPTGGILMAVNTIRKLVECLKTKPSCKEEGTPPVVT